MPPLGKLDRMAVLVAAWLAENVSVALNTGTHTELMRMASREFARVVQPKVITMASP
jgi:Ala-tRNA(Pro) deacylase